MKGRRHNNKRRNGRKGGRRGPSEGNGRRASTIITNLIEVPAGVSGAEYTVEELLRKYFQDPRLIKIYMLKIKIQPLDQTQPYYQVQSFVTLDQPGTQLVTMSSVIQGSILSKRITNFIAQPRRFWVEDKVDNFTFLDLRFQAFKPTQLIVEVQTFFHIEIDELTPLSTKTMQAIPELSQDELDDVASHLMNFTLAAKPRYSSKPINIKK